MNLTAGELADVLLVEDDPGDALLIQESFGPAGSSNRRCHVASHSDQALRFVRRTGEFADAPQAQADLAGPQSRADPRPGSPGRTQKRQRPAGSELRLPWATHQPPASSS